jgi:hypothetical protein
VRKVGGLLLQLSGGAQPVYTQPTKAQQAPGAPHQASTTTVPPVPATPTTSTPVAPPQDSKPTKPEAGVPTTTANGSGLLCLSSQDVFAACSTS